MQYINYNGVIHPASEPLLCVDNRAFKYGDGFFESIVMFNRKMPLLQLHCNRIQYTAEALFMHLPAKLTPENLESQIHNLALVNGSLLHVRVRLQFYRKGEGLYLPNTDEVGYVITMEPLQQQMFECGNGLTVGLRNDFYKPIFHLSDLKTTSALAYVQFAQYAADEKMDEMIILNNLGNVCESVYSNVVIVRDNLCYTPDLDSGCVNGVLRSYLLAEIEAQIVEKEITVEELISADEILLTNAVKGVRWVKQLNGKVYTNKKAVELTAFLNHKLLDIS